MFIANTAVTATLFGYGFSQKDGAIFLAPLAILIPSLFFVASQFESTTRISQYLRVVLEPRLNIRWQTQWYALRQQSLLPHKRKYVAAITILYGALGVTCLVLAGFYWKYRYWLFVIVVLVALGLLATAVRVVQRAFSMNFRDSYARAWQELLSRQSRGE